uniref:Uncharacterized protein n=1 Tax=Arion vulgaris TaxID=1028688 RepID=A0A0B7AZL1_9EUPU
MQFLYIETSMDSLLHQSSTCNAFLSLLSPFTLCIIACVWTLTTNEKKRIQTTEMKWFLLILNVISRDKIRNDKIRRKMGSLPVLQYIKKQQVK